MAAARIGALLLVALALLWPALLNGYPLVFSDSSDYLTAGWQRGVPLLRPPAYGWLAMPLHGGVTLWPVVVVQVLASAWTIALALRVAGGGPVAPSLLVLVGGALAAVSSLPWFAAWVMPDLFAGLAILSAALLVAGGSLLGRVERGGLWLLFTVSVATHLTHMPVALAVLGMAVLLRMLLGAERISLAAVAACLLGLGVAAVADSVLTWLSTGRLAMSEGGALFLAGRLAGDGLLQAWLSTHCPQPDLTLCARIARIPHDLDEFLWSPDSPVWDTGSLFALVDELGRINNAVLLDQWPAVLANGLGRAWRQFLALGIGDGLDPALARDAPERFRVLGLDTIAAAIAGAEQGRAPLAGAWLPVAVRAAGLAGFGLMLVRLAFGRGFRAGAAGVLALLVLAGALANALVIGLFAAVHPRYQARLAWLFVLLALAPTAPHQRRRAGRPQS